MRLPRTSRRRARLGALVGLLALFTTACEEDAPQDYLDPAGPFAEEADFLWDLTFGIAVVVFIVVEFALLFVLIRFRHRPGRKASQFHGNTRLEVILTVIPAMILAGIAVPTVDTIFDLARKPSDAMEVTVTAHRFWWEFEYPEEEIKTANEMHIPVDQPVYVTLVGATTDPVDQEPEVVHSFWVPRLGGKQDIIPGREANLLIEADEADVYLGQCAEYCGLSHANMRLRVVAEEQEDFDAWVERQREPAQPPAGSAAEGEQIFQQGGDGISQPCSGCHSVEAAAADDPGIAPNLANFSERETFAGAMFPNEPRYLREWIADPAAVKPGAKMPDVGASPEQIDALVAYLQSLD